MVKRKICKGNGRAKGHGCGKLVDVEKYGKSNRKYGLGINDCKCYSTWLLTTDEGKAQLERETIKAKQPRIELEKARQEIKGEQSLSWLKINIRTVCHDYIKLRDKGLPCVSCGSPWTSDHQAGHLYKAELFSMLKYDERNIHNQCKKCNIFDNGNESMYHAAILSRISIDDYDELKRIASQEKQTNFKWDRQELEKIRNYYKLKIKQLEKNEK